MEMVTGSKLLQFWQQSEPLFELIVAECNGARLQETILEDILKLLEQYKAITPDELPAELPPLRNIQHQIDFIPGASLPHYLLNLKEQHILQELVDQLLDKQLIQPSVSPCGVPALLVPKMDGSW